MYLGFFYRNKVLSLNSKRIPSVIVLHSSHKMTMSDAVKQMWLTLNTIHGVLSQQIITEWQIFQTKYESNRIRRCIYVSVHCSDNSATFDTFQTFQIRDLKKYASHKMSILLTIFSWKLTFLYRISRGNDIVSIFCLQNPTESFLLSRWKIFLGVGKWFSTVSGCFRTSYLKFILLYGYSFGWFDFWRNLKWLMITRIFNGRQMIS